MILESSILLAPKASAIRERAARWLSSRCEFISQLTGCTVTNHSLVLSQAAGALLAAAVILCSTAAAEYGWAALCAMEGVRLMRPIVREIMRQEGGAR